MALREGFQVLVTRLKPYWLLAGLSAFSVLFYLLVSLFYYRLGFPLDDAWIHQTYARNLAFYGEWAFQLGSPSAGSTSPLWSGMLCLGYLLGKGTYVWTYLLGWLFFFGIAIMGSHFLRNQLPAQAKYAFWVGIFLVFEWHLVWAAASGMETLAFAFIILVTLTILSEGYNNWLVLGLLIGLNLWLRPDGITLAGPVFVCALIYSLNWRERLLAIGKIGLGIGVFLVPYLVFNHFLSGSWWPNTLYAKQAEYAVYRQLPFARRWLAQGSLPLIGSGALLLPGFVLFVIHALRRRAWRVLMGVVWILGYFTLYAWRLPVTYQHGRYIIPAMPVYYVFSLAGLFFVLRTSSPIFWRRVLGRSYLISLGLVLISFWFIGANAYARDVAVIESEMVVAARWVAANTETGALVAAHDIGAMGYFGERKLLDLAGLVSPEVIPFIRDEVQLKAFLDERKANYLVTFPDWYPYLAKYGELIYTTSGFISPMLGGENMSIYRWYRP